MLSGSWWPWSELKRKMFSLLFVHVYLSQSVLASNAHIDPRYEPLLSRSRFEGECADKISDNQKIKVSEFKMLNDDIIREIVKFVGFCNGTNYDNLRLTSTRCGRACGAVLRDSEEKSYHLLFTQTKTQKRLRDWNDIQKSTKLIPEISIDLTVNQSMDYLFALHSRFGDEVDIIRGFHSDPNIAFLQIQLIDDDNWDHRMYPIFVFCADTFRCVSLGNIHFEVHHLDRILEGDMIQIPTFRPRVTWSMRKRLYGGGCRKKCGERIASVCLIPYECLRVIMCFPETGHECKCSVAVWILIECVVIYIVFGRT